MRSIFCISLVFALTLTGGALNAARAADVAAAAGDAASQPGWHLAYDKKAQTCSVGSYVGNGIFVSIGSERGRMSLSVDDINNDLDVQKSYDTTLKMDKGYSKTLPVRPYWINSFAIRLSDDAAMLTAFKASQGFEIGIGGRSYAFQVQDMAKVMADIEGCQASAAQQAQAAPAPAATVPAVAAGAVATGAVVAASQTAQTASAAPALAAASPVSASSAPLRIVPLAGVKAGASAAPKTMEQVADEAASAATDKVIAGQAAVAPANATTTELNASQAAKAKAGASAAQPAAAAAADKGRKGAAVPPPSLAAIDAQKQAILEADVAKNAPKSDLKEQDVAALPVPANPRILADNVTPASAGPGCVSEDRYANLVRKVGLLEVEKEKLRKLSLAAEQGPLQSVMQCAAETNQIKELKGEIAMLRAENDKMRSAAQEAQAASAVDPTDNLSAALNELDEATKNDKK